MLGDFIFVWGLPRLWRGRYVSRLAVRSAPPLAGLGLTAHRCTSLGPRLNTRLGSG